jgi:hypothetical protein
LNKFFKDFYLPMKRTHLIAFFFLPLSLLAQEKSYFRIKQQTIQYWAGSWENYERLSFTYDSMGNLSEKLKEQFTLNTSSGSWNLFSKENTVYDSLDRPLQTITSLYSNGNWNNYFKIDLAYDSLGNQIYKTSSNWLNGQWNTQLGEKRIYSYNNNLPDSIIFQSWNPNSSQFENNSCYLFHYTNNALDWIEVRKWNNTWTNYQKIQNLDFFLPYSSGDFWKWYQTNLSAYEKMDNTGSSLVPFEKGVLDFLNPGVLLSELYQHGANGTWNDSSKTEYQYYQSNGRIKEIDEFSFVNNAWYQYNGTYTTYTDNADGNIDYQIEKDWQNQAWENQKKIIYTYEFQTGLPALADDLPKLYPNPAQNEIYLPTSTKKEHYQLLNNQGQLVWDGQPDGNKIDVSQLKPGLYLIRTHQGIKLGRFIKE